MNNTNIDNNPDCQCCWSVSTTGTYISLGFNLVLAITTFVSEAMGTNQKSDRNGIIDAILKTSKNYRLTRTTET